MKALNDIKAEEVKAGASIAPEPMIGTWFNTNNGTQGIAKAVLALQGREITLHIYAVGDPARSNWGETTVNLFAANTQSAEAMAFSAFYDFGFMETHLQGHVRQGVLIIAKFDRFKDDSGRSNYFSKEFFYRSDS